MGFRLPNQLGRSASEDSRRRFIATPLMAAGGALDLSRFENDRRKPEISDAYSRLSQGRMPRNAGMVALRSDIGAFDLQALRYEGGEVKISPQSKSVVDAETKEPKEAGALIFSTMDFTRTGELKSFCTRAIGVAINPDENPWLADELGVDRRWKQNNYGMVIVTTVPFAMGSFLVRPEIKSAEPELILPETAY